MIGIHRKKCITTNQLLNILQHEHTVTFLLMLKDTLFISLPSDLTGFLDQMRSALCNSYNLTLKEQSLSSTDWIFVIYCNRKHETKCICWSNKVIFNALWTIYHRTPSVMQASYQGSQKSYKVMQLLKGLCMPHVTILLYCFLLPMCEQPAMTIITRLF